MDGKSTIDGKGNVENETGTQELIVLEYNGAPSLVSIEVAQGGIPFGGDKALFATVAILLGFECDRELPEICRGEQGSCAH